MNEEIKNKILKELDNNLEDMLNSIYENMMIGTQSISLKALFDTFQKENKDIISKELKNFCSNCKNNVTSNMRTMDSLTKERQLYYYQENSDDILRKELYEKE